MSKLSKRDQLVLLMVISSIVLAFGIVLLPRGGTSAPAPTKDAPVNVYVTGYLLLRGEGDTPMTLNFTEASGYVYSIVVRSDSFGLFLENDQVYNVTIGWVGSYPWQKGVVSASSFTLNATSNADNLGDIWSSAMPPSMAQLQGPVTVTGLTPTEIIFSGAVGNFTATISADQFSLQIPNLTSYSVEIIWQGGECSAGSFGFDYNPATTSSPGITRGFAC